MEPSYEVMEELLRSAQSRWLTSFEIITLIQNHDAFGLPSRKQILSQPPSGTLCVYDKRHTPYFRRDGHEWMKKKNGKRVREDHERLKLGGKEVLSCYYAHHATEPGFHRRVYWIISQPEIALVHYLNSGSSSGSRSSAQRGGLTTAAAATSATASTAASVASRTTSATTTTTTTSTSVSSGSGGTAPSGANSTGTATNGGTTSASSVVGGVVGGATTATTSATTTAASLSGGYSLATSNSGLGSSPPPGGQARRLTPYEAAQKHLQQQHYPGDPNSYPSPSPEAPQYYDTEMVEANGGTQPLFDIGEFVSGTTPLFADLPSVPLQLSPVSPVASTAAASTVGSSLPATAPPATLAGTSPPISQQTPVQTVATSAEPNPTLSALPPTASPVLCGDVDMVDSAQTPHAKPTLFASGVGTAGPADPAGAVGVGVGVGSDTTSSSATEAAAAAAAAVPLDSTILDFSPDWDWETGGAKILVTGVFGGGDLTVPIWCMFGDLEVPCVRVLPNVLRCYAPPHAPGVVGLVITYGDSVPRSHASAFEYRGPRHAEGFAAWVAHDMDFRLDTLERIKQLEFARGRSPIQQSETCTFAGGARPPTTNLLLLESLCNSTAHSSGPRSEHDSGRTGVAASERSTTPDPEPLSSAAVRAKWSSPQSASRGSGTGSHPTSNKALSDDDGDVFSATASSSGDETYHDESGSADSGRGSDSCDSTFSMSSASSSSALLNMQSQHHSEEDVREGGGPAAPAGAAGVGSGLGARVEGSGVGVGVGGGGGGGSAGLLSGLSGQPTGATVGTSTISLAAGSDGSASNASGSSSLQRVYGHHHDNHSPSRYYGDDEVSVDSEDEDVNDRIAHAIVAAFRAVQLRCMAVLPSSEFVRRVNAADKRGGTLLHYAAASGFADLMVVLIDAGARVHTLDRDGRSCLHWAAMAGQVSCISVALSYRADPRDTDHAECAPSDYAREFGYWECLSKLEEAEKQIDMEVLGIAKPPSESTMKIIGESKAPVVTVVKLQTRFRERRKVKAAARIQSVFRGHRVRQELTASRRIIHWYRSRRMISSSSERR